VSTDCKSCIANFPFSLLKIAENQSNSISFSQIAVLDISFRQLMSGMCTTHTDGLMQVTKADVAVQWELVSDPCANIVLEKVPKSTKNYVSKLATLSTNMV
jgi:hypothetical protein